MKKDSQNPFEYPVVLRQVLNDLVISVPDLGYWKSIPLNSAKTSSLDQEFLNSLTESIKQTWTYVENHINKKKWIPEPSTFRQTLQAPQDKDFTLPEFTKQLQVYMNISENTVRREIQRGTIQCYQTEGGHRRIPFQELELYLSKRKTQKDL